VSTGVGADPSLRRITPTGGDRLEFRFTEDCWVEIKSATGASLYSDLSRSGGSLELVGQAPFRILLGYAPGVSMSFNAEAVALAPHTRNNVANLVLGQ
jgi:cytoskeleton protein RodZ